MIPPVLLSFFHSRGLFTWNNLIDSWSSLQPIWKNDLQLAISPPLRPLWLSFTQCFSHRGLLQLGTKDELIWSPKNKILPISVRFLYSVLSADIPPSPSIFPVILWKAPSPLKSILFSWLLFSNKNLSWEVLQKKGWHRLGRCHLCLAEAETNYHMFFQCAASSAIWYELSLIYVFPHWCFSSVQEAFLWWGSQCSNWHALFILTCWHIWKWRNGRIFQGCLLPLDSILSTILGSMQLD